MTVQKQGIEVGYSELNNFLSRDTFMQNDKANHTFFTMILINDLHRIIFIYTGAN